MALANCCCGIVKRLQSAVKAEGTNVQYFILPQHIEDDVARLADTVRETWPGRFSTTNLQKRIGRMVSDVAAESESIGQETHTRFIAFFAELDLFAERKLCIAPVEGVTLVNDDPVVFGPFVLQRATQSVLDRIHTLNAEMLGRTLHTRAEQVGIAADLRRHAEESLAGSVILEFEVTADAEQAHSVFLEKANMLVDLLQMSTQIAEFCESIRVGLRGHPHAGSYSAWILPLNPGDWLQPANREHRKSLPLRGKSLSHEESGRDAASRSPWTSSHASGKCITAGCALVRPSNAPRTRGPQHAFADSLSRGYSFVFVWTCSGGKCGSVSWYYAKRATTPIHFGSGGLFCPKSRGS